MNLRSLLLAAAAVASVSASAYAVDPVLHYTFNEGSGTAVNNSGTAGDTGDMTMGASAGWTTGVSGSAYFGTGGGTFGGTSYAKSPGRIADLDTDFSSPSVIHNALTITGWMNLASWNGGMFITNYFDGGWPSGFWLNTSDTAGALNLTIGNNGGAQSATTVFDDNLNGWLFFAVTWSGVSNSVQFYKGTEAEAAAATGGAVTGNGFDRIHQNDSGMAVGSGSTDNSWWVAFQGGLDDIRVYNTVLTGSEIEAVRASVVPEPGSVALLIAGLAGLALKRRRA